jgi:capsular polysaccharide transport system permease protein
MKNQKAQGLTIQANVVGALIMRELHTRFGRENIGYFWIFAEPMLLAAAVALLHSSQHLPLSGGIRPIPFAIGGYGLFIMFRSVVSRAETLLEANKPLLSHRQVTLFDMLFARSILELASTTFVLSALLFGAWLFDLADPVADIVKIGGAVGLLAWMSFGLAMLVTAGSHVSAAFGRLIHPILYLTMPLSGAFFAMEWLPSGIRDSLSWFPMVSIFELLKAGQFSEFTTTYVNLGYVSLWCIALTCLGMIALRAIRPSIALS